MTQQGDGQPRSWWSRNWAWVVPTGCLGLLLMPFACVGAVGFLLSGALRSSDVFTQALEMARSHPEVIEALGDPVEPGWSFHGSIDVDGSSGDADYSIPIKGPRGEATLHVVASKRGGRWVFETLIVEIESDGRRIDVLDPTLQARAMIIGQSPVLRPA